MDPTHARAQLLREHDRLRELIRAALAAEDVDERRRALEELRLAFAAHNGSEEVLLVPVLAGDPAWGPARIARMMEEHVAEHAAMRALMAGEEATDHLAEIAEELDAHMAAEERTFLSAHVLRPR